MLIRPGRLVVSFQSHLTAMKTLAYVRSEHQWADSQSDRRNQTRMPESAWSQSVGATDSATRIFEVEDDNPRKSFFYALLEASVKQ
jgi:hypothetical protein